MGDQGFPPGLPQITPPDSYADQTPPPPVIKVSTQCMGAPTTALNVQNETITNFARMVGSAMCSFGAPFWMQTLVAGFAYFVPSSVSLVLQIAARLIAPVLGVVVAPVLAALNDLRKGLDPAAATLAVDVLSELLGTEFSASLIASGSDITTHLANANTIGGLLHTQLLSEFAGSLASPGTTGNQAARTFSGLVINFGMATGILGLLGSMVPELRLEEARQIGEEVARNLGLGRMHRRALQPLIDLCVGLPLKYWINHTYHPAQFTVGDVVNPFAQTAMSPAVVATSLDLQGYTVAQINSLLALHEKRLTLEQVDSLMRYGAWTIDQGTKYAEGLGYDPALIAAAFTAVSLTRADQRLGTFITVIETAYTKGEIDAPTLTTLLQALPIDPTERNLILTTSEAKLQYQLGKVHKAPRAVYEYAFEHDLIDLTELQEAYALEGIDEVDQQLLLQVQLYKLNKLEAAAAAKAAKAAAAAAKAAATVAASGTTPTPTPAPAPKPAGT